MHASKLNAPQSISQLTGALAAVVVCLRAILNLLEKLFFKPHDWLEGEQQSHADAAAAVGATAAPDGHKVAGEVLQPHKLAAGFVVNLPKRV